MLNYITVLVELDGEVYSYYAQPSSTKPVTSEVNCYIIYDREEWVGRWTKALGVTALDNKALYAACVDLARDGLSIVEQEATEEEIEKFRQFLLPVFRSITAIFKRGDDKHD
jgi:hypothetical protein